MHDGIRHALAPLARVVPALLLVPLLAGCDDGNGAEPPDAAEAAAAQADTAEPVDLARVGHDRGRFDAPVRVIEFSDFGCPHCQSFHRETFPVLEEEYIDAGNVIWKYIPVVIVGAPNSREITEAAECAGEQREFFALAERIYSDPDAWTETDDPHGVAAGWAEDEGLDVERFRSCLAEGRMEPAVEEHTQVAVQLGLRATPTFVVNGMPIQGAVPLETFQEILDDQLEGRGPPTGP